MSVNCVCLPDARLESELFGDVNDIDWQSHVGRRPEAADGRGRLEAADGGTVMLQDVGYLSWRLQGRLLRYTEAREGRRVGSELMSSDVRLMAITNRRLVHAVASQAFRDDLFYRMNVIHIEVPPLRERSEDVSALLRYFVCVHAARLGRPVIDFTPDALNCLTDYDWPGNVRELKDVSERLVETHDSSERVGMDALPQKIERRSMSRTVARWASPAPHVPAGPARVVILRSPRPAAPLPLQLGAMSNEDRLFATTRVRNGDFTFGKDTAAVFDDMLDRSVPFYGEIQRMIGELAADFAADGTTIYDLGCSTANTLLSVGAQLRPDSNLRFVGIDSSEDMLQKAEQKLAASRFPWPYTLTPQDLNDSVRIENASVALMVLTLQFVRPLNREGLISSVYRGLNHNGCFLLVEKVLGEHSNFNRLFIDHYYEMKRRKGYSDLEIAQKREALENVLIPYRLEENKRLLRQVGFQHVDVFFKWYNFCGIIAIK